MRWRLGVLYSHTGFDQHGRDPNGPGSFLVDHGRVGSCHGAGTALLSLKRTAIIAVILLLPFKPRLAAIHAWAPKKSSHLGISKAKLRPDPSCTVAAAHSNHSIRRQCNLMSGRCWGRTAAQQVAGGCGGAAYVARGRMRAAASAQPVPAAWAGRRSWRAGAVAWPRAALWRRCRWNRSSRQSESASLRWGWGRRRSSQVECACAWFSCDPTHLLHHQPPLSDSAPPRINTGPRASAAPWTLAPPSAAAPTCCW
jgi:hypothetical protein